MLPLATTRPFLAILTSSSPRSSPEVRRPGQRRGLGGAPDTLPARGHRPPAHLRRPPGRRRPEPRRAGRVHHTPHLRLPRRGRGALHRCARQPCLPRFLEKCPAISAVDTTVIDDSTGTNSTSSSTPGATGGG